MPRTNQDGKDIRLVLEWLCRKHLPDTELAAALDKPPSSYDRRKTASDFPSFEELEAFAEYFNLSARALQCAFGYMDPDEVLMNEEALRQYHEQGGGTPPFFPTPRGDSRTIVHTAEPVTRRRRTHRVDAPPGP
jgi:hypothetical protein